MTQRITSVDALRGVAALCVVWFHLTGSSGAASQSLRTSGSWGYLGVEAFFVISGFIIPYSMYNSGYTLRSFVPFMARRLVRLEPPYWASIALVLVSTFVLSRVAHTLPVSMSAKQFALHLAYLIPFSREWWLSPVYWTLAVEFQFYVIVALAYPLVASNREAYPNFVFAVLIAAAVLGRAYSAIVLPYLPLFVLGMALFRYRVGLATRDGALASFLVSTAFTGMVVGFPQMLIGVAACCVLASPWVPGATLRFLGRISYSLYLTHWTVGQIAVAGLRYVTPNEWIQRGTALLICIVVAYGFYRVVEDPAIRISKLVAYRPHAASSESIATA